MTLQEAINSGKRFRRKGWTVVVTVDPAYWLQAGRTLHLSTEDILADDWEIEEVRVTINASDLKMAWIKACENIKRYDDTTPSHWLCVELKKELGL